jgi:NADPH:quinone reductase-like Zn-dependent oxidoreductase
VEEGTGAFNEYSRVPGRRCIHIPDTMSMNEAATIPLAALTACSGLYQMFKLPEPLAALSGTPILVWAGSSIPVSTHSHIQRVLECM